MSKFFLEIIKCIITVISSKKKDLVLSILKRPLMKLKFIYMPSCIVIFQFPSRNNTSYYYSKYINRSSYPISVLKQPLMKLKSIFL